MEINVIPDSFEAAGVDYPFKAPFILSSAENYWCMSDPAKIVYIKRRHLEENLKVIAGEIGMDEGEQKKFMDYWCQPSNRSASEILAEVIRAFDLRYRATSWMEGKKPQAKQTKSRLEQYAESARQAFGNPHSVPAGDSQSAGPGYAVLPDEQ